MLVICHPIVSASRRVVVLSTLTAALLLCIGCDPRRVDDRNSADVAESLEVRTDGLVLIKFGATWCGPCRKVDHELDQLEVSTSGLEIVRVDVDRDPGLARQFKVSSIPHLVLVRDGQRLDQQVGFRSAAELRQWAERFGRIDQAGPTSQDAAPTPGGQGAVHANPFAN